MHVRDLCFCMNSYVEVYVYFWMNITGLCFCVRLDVRKGFLCQYVHRWHSVYACECFCVCDCVFVPQTRRGRGFPYTRLYTRDVRACGEGESNAPASHVYACGRAWIGPMNGVRSAGLYSGKSRVQFACSKLD